LGARKNDKPRIGHASIWRKPLANPKAVAANIGGNKQIDLAAGANVERNEINASLRWTKQNGFGPLSS
jgi:hypothetical protein